MKERWGLDGTSLVIVAACASAFYGFAMIVNAATGGVELDAGRSMVCIGFGVFLALLAIFLRLGKIDRD